jgi:hypothetical protein
LIGTSLLWLNYEQKQSNGGRVSKDSYYSDTVARLDTIIGGDTQNFARLQQAKKEWDQLAADVPVGQGFLTFHDYVREYYGVKLEYDGDNVSLAYSVIDEKKYTVFLLKFNR